MSELWLVESDHMTWILASDWSVSEKVDMSELILYSLDSIQCWHLQCYTAPTAPPTLASCHSCHTSCHSSHSSSYTHKDFLEATRNTPVDLDNLTYGLIYIEDIRFLVMSPSGCSNVTVCNSIPCVATPQLGHMCLMCLTRPWWSFN